MKRILVFCSAGLIACIVYIVFMVIQEKSIGGYFPKLTGLLSVGIAAIFVKIAIDKGWTTEEEVPVLFEREEQPNKLEFK